MCGIVGFVNRPGRPADRAIVERMTATVAHRGPDGDGIYCEGRAALGHRRLSIIDVAGGAQPMCNEDGTIWITYNGELYNELELKKELLAKGHVYRTSCDTETLIHLYEEEGLDFARRLNGMFSAAIWDSQRGRLVLVRDRMGQKPLYYGELPDGGLAFGSELKAIVAHPAHAERLTIQVWSATSFMNTSRPRTRSGSRSTSFLAATCFAGKMARCRFLGTGLHPSAVRR